MLVTCFVRVACGVPGKGDSFEANTGRKPREDGGTGAGFRAGADRKLHR